MKAKELAELLLQHPELEVQCVFADTSKCSPSHLYPDYHFVSITGISDIWYHSDVIVLDTE